MKTLHIPHYAIIGGGLSGLSASYFLSLLKPNKSCKITIFEASSRLGGHVQTVHNASTGSFSDLGPHTARIGSPTSSLLLRLALNLGLRDSMVFLGSKNDMNNRYIYLNDRLMKLPMANLIGPPPFTRSPLGLLVRRALHRKPLKENEFVDISVDEFFRTRFDNEFADYLGSALIRGIFAGDSRELSMEACLPQMLEAERQGFNLLHGLALMSFRPRSVPLPGLVDAVLASDRGLVPPGTVAWSLQAGMQTLVDSLAVELRSSHASTVAIHTDTSIEGVQPLLSSNCPGFSLHVVDRKTQATSRVAADAVFFCCPAYATAKLLSNGGDFLSPSLVARLTADCLPWTSVAVCVLELKNRVLPPVIGFGHLVPRCEDAHVLGVIYDSICLAHLDGGRESTTRYTVMLKPHTRWLKSNGLGSSPDRGVLKEIESASLQVLSRQLGIHQPVLVNCRAVLWRDCIPQYPVGHRQNVAAFRVGVEDSLTPLGLAGRLYFAGSSYDGVSLGDVVFSSVNAVAAELTHYDEERQLAYG